MVCLSLPSIETNSFWHLFPFRAAIVILSTIVILSEAKDFVVEVFDCKSRSFASLRMTIWYCVSDERFPLKPRQKFRKGTNFDFLGRKLFLFEFRPGIAEGDGAVEHELLGG